MIIFKLHIENFRALKNVTFDMSSFSCLIGENNSGKSSLLHALHRFLDGAKLLETDYYDKTRPVLIRADLGILDSDLQLLKDEEHRSRIGELLSDGRLQLTRVFQFGQKGEFRCTRKVPQEERWRDDVIEAKLKGKKSSDLRTLMDSEYPEVASDIQGTLTQKKVKEEIQRQRGPLNLVWQDEPDAPLPTGIDNSVAALLPEPIYIQAVKDIAADVKTTDRAVFGKLLGLLLNAIQPQLDDIRQALAELDKKLNIYTSGSGKKVDDRIKHIQEIEQLLQKNLRENFPAATVAIEIPPPEIKTILQSARITIHDGAIVGPVETKGDGLKRSVLFSLFRAYVQLANTPGWNPKAQEDQALNYLILFEEPELYLHPKAQQVLFDSLAEVAKDFQVIVTTHSPLFFSAKNTKTFAKLIKSRGRNGIVPFSELISVDLEKDLSVKDEFQILCYENNNVAFFANSVVLVEGDSDVAALKHLACILNSAWDFDKGKVRMVKVGGKGNFLRYIDFFKRFRIETLVLADLDALVTNFDKLGLPNDSPCVQERASLLNKVAQLITTPEMNGDKVKETWKQRGQRIYAIVAQAKSGQSIQDKDIDFLNAVQDDLGLNQAKVNALKDVTKLQADKQALLRDLRAKGVMILERGDLEDYYPNEITGPDKTSKANDFRKKITKREQALQLASDVPTSDGKTRNEFEAIFARVFEDTDALSVRA